MKVNTAQRRKAGVKGNNTAALLHGLCTNCSTTGPDLEMLKSTVVPSLDFCVAFLE